jgi:hypothetical protein
MMRLLSLVTGLIVMGVLAGCAGNGSLVEQEWGTAYKLTIANQTLNPNAEKNLEPVYGLGNKAADKVVNKYNKEFDKAPQVPVYTLGIAGGLGTTSMGSSGTGSQY